MIDLTKLTTPQLHKINLTMKQRWLELLLANDSDQEKMDAMERLVKDIEAEIRRRRLPPSED